MAMMDVSYDLIFKGEREPERIRHAACFSGLFGMGRKDVERMRVWYWYIGQDKNDADYFLDNFVLKSIPNRVNDEAAFSFNFEAPKQEEEVITLSYPHWVTLDVDLTKISANDLYILLVLFRYPQENTKLVEVFKELVEKDKKSIDVAFVESHAVNATGYGHLMLHYNTSYFLKGGGKVSDEFSFKNLWENLPKEWKGNSQSFSKCDRKYGSINPHFLVG